MAEFQPIIYFVAISATYAGNCHVSRLFKIGQDCLRTSFGDSDRIGYIADSWIWVSTEMHKNVTMIREKGPFSADFWLVLHAQTLAEIWYLK